MERQTIVTYFDKDKSFQNCVSSINSDQNHDGINFFFVGMKIDTPVLNFIYKYKNCLDIFEKGKQNKQTMTEFTTGARK